MRGLTAPVLFATKLTQAVRKPQSVNITDKGAVVTASQQANAFSPASVTHVLRGLEQVRGLSTGFQLYWS